jgi:formylglycine-generating enzyme required for sulfatase activity
MGSPGGEKGRSYNEGPQHEVPIGQPFAVGKTEVTLAEQDACVAVGPPKPRTAVGVARIVRQSMSAETDRIGSTNCPSSHVHRASVDPSIPDGITCARTRCLQAEPTNSVLRREGFSHALLGSIAYADSWQFRLSLTAA